MVLDDLGYSRVPRGDDGKTHCHRFQDHVRNAVAVAVLRYDARQHEQRCPGILFDNFIVRKRATERDRLLQSELTHLRFQRRTQWAFAHDLALEVIAVCAERPAGSQQIGKTLLFLELPDRQQDGSSIGRRSPGLKTA